MSSEKAYSVDSLISHDHLKDLIIAHLIAYGYERDRTDHTKIIDVEFDMNKLPNPLVKHDERNCLPITIKYKSFEPEVHKVLSNGEK